MPTRPIAIHRAIIQLLTEHEHGLTSGQIRDLLGLGADEQAQLDRRRRELYRWFVIERLKLNGQHVYRYVGERPVLPNDAPGVTAKSRAAALHAARGRCQMCGRSIHDDRIKLVVDHKIPQDWGGTDDLSNLWALCEECNGGKKNHFASFDASKMRELMRHQSVHVRVGELLKLHLRVAVAPELIEIVAGQDDWKKRLRELRYLNWRIAVVKRKTSSGKMSASYRLDHFTEWPEDPTGVIRRFEVERAKRNRGL